MRIIINFKSFNKTKQNNNIWECGYLFLMKENISRKVTSEDNRSGQIVEADKALSWNFLSWSGAIPIRLYFIENQKDLSVDAIFPRPPLHFLYSSTLFGIMFLQKRTESTYIGSTFQLPSNIFINIIFFFIYTPCRQ